MKHHTEAPPLVSVVMATYGRPQVLRWAIESVRRQSLRHWELLVVGDACDEATAAVALEQAAQDDRIRFINLHTNHGEQSGPNNVGVARSSGQYIAFLNQDDLWFDDHLSQLVDWLEATGSDLVYGLSVHLLHGSQAWPNTSQVNIGGLGHGGLFDPLSTMTPASAWLMRRQCAQQTGPWRPAVQCLTESSQEFLLRAWRKGLRLSNCPVPTVLVFSSGARAGSYVSTADAEQVHFTDLLLRDQAHLRTMLTAHGHFPVAPYIGRTDMSRVQRWALTWLSRWAIHPRAWYLRRQGSRRPGHYIRALRQTRGLPTFMAAQASAAELKRAAAQALCEAMPDQAIDFREGGLAWRHQGQGWSTLETNGCWTDGPIAELLLRLPPPTSAASLTLTLQPFVSRRHPRQRLTVHVNGHEVSMQVLQGEEARDLVLTLHPHHWAAGNLLHITLLMPDAIAPARVKRKAHDQRRLGLFVRSLVLSLSTHAPPVSAVSR